MKTAPARTEPSPISTIPLASTLNVVPWKTWTPSPSRSPGSRVLRKCAKVARVCSNRHPSPRDTFDGSSERSSMLMGAPRDAATALLAARSRLGAGEHVLFPDPRHRRLVCARAATIHDPAPVNAENPFAAQLHARPVRDQERRASLGEAADGLDYRPLG